MLTCPKCKSTDVVKLVFPVVDVPPASPGSAEPVSTTTDIQPTDAGVTQVGIPAVGEKRGKRIAIRKRARPRKVAEQEMAALCQICEQEVPVITIRSGMGDELDIGAKCLARLESGERLLDIFDFYWYKAGDMYVCIARSDVQPTERKLALRAKGLVKNEDLVTEPLFHCNSCGYEGVESEFRAEDTSATATEARDIALANEMLDLALDMIKDHLVEEYGDDAKQVMQQLEQARHTYKVTAYFEDLPSVASTFEILHDQDMPVDDYLSVAVEWTPVKIADNKWKMVLDIGGRVVAELERDLPAENDDSAVQHLVSNLRLEAVSLL